MQALSPSGGCHALALAVALLAATAPTANAQVSKTGGCPNYQTDRTFDVEAAMKLVGETFYISHALNNSAEQGHTCSKITLYEDHTFKYDFKDSTGLLTYYDGQWSVFPTTLTSPGRLVLQFKYINILGSNVRGQSLLNVLFLTDNSDTKKLLTVVTCIEQVFGYYKEYLYTLATEEVASMEPFFQEQKDLLIAMGTPNAGQLLQVTQNCF